MSKEGENKGDITKVIATHPKIGEIELEPCDLSDLDLGDLKLHKVDFIFTKANGSEKIVSRYMTEQQFERITEGLSSL